MGYASQIILFYGSISYILILAWAFFYLFSSFSGNLPWATCNNTWNTGSVRTPYTDSDLWTLKCELQVDAFNNTVIYFRIMRGAELQFYH